MLPYQIFGLALVCVLVRAERKTCGQHCICQVERSVFCAGQEIDDLKNLLLNYSFGYNLELLYMDNIAATRIPPRIFESSELATLQEMKFINSNIKRIHPKAFSSLNHLRILDLRNNSIISLGKAPIVINYNLNILRLSRNNITTLNFMHKLHNLRVLEADNNVIEELGPAAFCNSSDFPSSLVEINLSHNNIEKFTVNPFQCLKKLVALDLSHNNLLTMQGKLFMNLTDLQILKLNDNKIIKLGGLFYLRSATDLNLRGNQIGQLKKNMFAFKERNATNIRNLDLSRNKIQSIHTLTFSALINLNFLFLSYNRLNSIENNTFESNKQLIYLDIRGNNLTDATFVNKRLTVILK